MTLPAKIFLLLFLMLLNQSVVWANESLSLGIFPRRSATLNTQLFTPLSQHISKQLARPVKLITPPDYPSFWQDMLAQKYDIVHFNQYHYIKSAHNYEVIARNVEFQRKNISSTFYVRKDSSINKLSDLKNKKVILGGCDDAMIACIVPRYLLLLEGLAKTDYQQLNTNRPPNALMAVFYKQADAAAAGNYVLELPIVKKLIKTKEIKKIGESKPLSHLPWGVKKSLATDLKERIQSVLTKLSQTTPGKKILNSARLSNIVSSTANDYQYSQQIVDYMNQNSLRTFYDTP